LFTGAGWVAACRPGAAASSVAASSAGSPIDAAVHANDRWQGNARLPDFSFAGYHMGGRKTSHGVRLKKNGVRRAPG